MSADLACPRRLTLRAGTPIAQELPGINPQLVAIVEMKLNRVFANAFRRSRFDGGLEHRQRPRRQLWRLSGLLMGLRSLLIAQRAGAGITQKREGIMRLVAALPLDVEARAGAQVHFNRLRICHCRHEFSIAQQN